MKTTGVVRKIDELGRIVIPKEIRKVLNINANDDLEINIENSEIVLKKYSFINGKIGFYNNIIKSFEIVLSGQVFIADKEKILTNGNFKNTLLDEFFIGILNDRKVYRSIALEKLIIGNLILEGYFFIKPIIVDSDAIGLIIYKTLKKLSIEEEKYIQVLHDLLSKI